MIGEKLRALHHFERAGASQMPACASLQVQPTQQAEPEQADANEIDGYNEVEQPRHDQDQNACDQSHDGRQVCSGDDHSTFSEVMLRTSDVMRGSRFGSRILAGLGE